MYAMLTGNLPFTVEPFNIKSLYNKMMKNEMNAIPEHLSKSGEDLLRKLLNPDPVKRISLKEAMEHPWLNEGYSAALKPFPYPNKPIDEQVNATIMRYMNTNMEFSLSEVMENIKVNKPSSSLATYYLLLYKVKSMLSKIDPKKVSSLLFFFLQYRLVSSPYPQIFVLCAIPRQKKF
jgi:Neu-associated kinase